MELFGSSGIRARALAELTPGDALEVAQAAGRVVDAARVAVARDTRTTGSLFVDGVAAGLAGVGCDVDRLGVVPTPALQAYCEREGVPGVMVTASHNPPEYNGIKLVGATGVELTRDRLEAVEEQVGNVPLTDWEGAGETRTVEGAARRYRERVLAAVDRGRVADADLTVALDPGHGAGAVTSPRLFRELGCEVLTVNAQPDGRFPGRDPEPVSGNLADLCRLVRTSEASAYDSGRYQRNAIRNMRGLGVCQQPGQCLQTDQQVRATDPQWVKTFERVDGATVEGTGPPNATVTASVRMEMPVANSTFTYRQQATTGENGEFTMTLPYSTTGYENWGPEQGYTNVSVRATGPYRIATQPTVDDNLTARRYSATVNVTEAQVIGEDDDPMQATLEEEVLSRPEGSTNTSSARRPVAPSTTRLRSPHARP